jgi:toxin ParE1/3/4
MRLRHTAAARQHIEEIFDYIAERDRAAASRVVMRIRAATDLLREFPHMGRHGAVGGTHEWVVTGLPYIIVYQVDPDQDLLTVMDVFHSARGRPRGPGARA